MKLNVSTTPVWKLTILVIQAIQVLKSKSQHQSAQAVQRFASIIFMNNEFSKKLRFVTTILISRLKGLSDIPMLFILIKSRIYALLYSRTIVIYKSASIIMCNITYTINNYSSLLKKFQGYDTVEDPTACCPRCVPTENIPSVCKVKNFRVAPITMEDKGSQCSSDKSFKHTGCAGLCESTVSAMPGNNMLTPSCSCCQPTRVVKHNVSMTCDDGHTFFVDFHEFQSCECKIQKCGSNYDTSGVEVVSAGGTEERSKRSFMDDLNDSATMNKESKERYRRNLLNDLAMLHANKKKR